jgi:putative peptide zinc metalloprotease protein
MNLSEALDAALPEIPRARLTRAHPPCLDPELIVREDMLDGEPIIGAFQRSQGNYFRFPPIQWELAQLFDGVRSYEEIATLFNETTGAEIVASDVRQFAQNMDEAEFWYKSPQERNIALSEKLNAERKRIAKRKSKVNLAHISFSAIDPDYYFTWLDSKVGSFVYSRWCFLSVLLLFFFESLVFLAKWNVIGPDIPLFYNFTKKSFLDIVQFWLLFLVLGFFHEVAHGLTCKHYGGEVHRMGLMLIYLTPAFFVDITETWISATKIQRLATIIAGIWIEMIFCGIAMIVWTNTQPGQWLHDFSYEIILITGIAVIIVNFNPLIKLDGYYFLTEIIGIADLKERSTAFLSGWVQGRILGLPVDLPVVARSRVPFFVVYAFCSGLYSYLLLFFVIRLAYNIGHNWFAEFALIPAGTLAFTIFRSRLVSLRDVIVRYWGKNFSPGIRLRPVPVLAASSLLVLLFVPIFRDHEAAFFVIEPARTSTLHAAAPGAVEAVLVYQGEYVRGGQPLLQLKSATVDSMRSSATAQADAARFQMNEAVIARKSAGTASASQEAAARSQALASATQTSLLLRAPAEGVLLTANPVDLLHQNVSSGQALLTIAESGPQVARVFIPAAALDRIPARAEVALALPGQFRILHLALAPIEGNPVTLPAGLIASQDYKGIKLPTFYTTRLPLTGAESELALGTSGEAKVFGARRSIFQRALTIGMNLLRAHIW